MKKAKKFSKPTVAEYLSAQIALSEKSQREIAAEIGYDKPNVLSMLKQGQTKVPMNKIGPLAKSLGFDPVYFLRLAMQEYVPETWEAIEDAVKGSLLKGWPKDVLLGPAQLYETLRGRGSDSEHRNV